MKSNKKMIFYLGSAIFSAVVALAIEGWPRIVQVIIAYIFVFAAWWAFREKTK